MPWLPGCRIVPARRQPTRAPHAWQPRVEALEIRAYLHGDEDHEYEAPDVANDPSATTIVLQHDTIPNFARYATHVAINSGNWNSPQIWAFGQVPTAGAIVHIAEGATVTINTVINPTIQAIGINPGAKLQFANYVNTRLTVGTMIVFEGGTLQIGTAAAPIAPNVKAELVIADRPLDLVNDPKQYGTGLIVAGKIEIAGSPLANTFVRMDRELRAGQTMIEVPVGSTSGWRVGDRILLPDTRQVPPTAAAAVSLGDDTAYPPNWEIATIAGISGKYVYLTAPIQFDHLGGYDSNGVLIGLPHVANLDRNVVIRSANPNGTRGHTLYGLHADINIQYASFKDLGRTSNAPLDNTTLDANGNVTHVGTNQIGRYAVHIHHVLGPENPTNTGYQFKFVGNTIENTTKWAIAIHGSSYGLIHNNVIYNAQGSGIATEDGTELYNEITKNFIARVGGNGERPDFGTKIINDTGRGGVGIWMHRSGNIIRDNVITGATFGGISYSGKELDNLSVGAFRGADPRNPAESLIIGQNPAGILDNNEVYGRTFNGVWISWPSNYRINVPTETLVLSNFRSWNTHGDAIFAEFLHSLLITNARIYGNSNLLANRSNLRASTGINLSDHTANYFVIENSIVDGFKIGIRGSSNDAGTIDTPGTIVRNVQLKNYINVWVETTHGDGKHLEVRNVQFAALDVPRLPDIDPYDFYLQYNAEMGQLLSTDVVRVIDMNGDPNADFRLYYPQQVGSFIVPPTAPLLGGAPVAGLTNSQLWQTYGVALGGAVAPSTSLAVAAPWTNGLAYRIDLVADIVAPSQVVRGKNLTYTLTAQDKSLSSQQNTFTWSIDWDGNGTIDQTVTGLSGTTVDHLYPINATTATIRVSAKNLAGDASATTSRAINVQGYRIVDNPAGGKTLEWAGTDGHDSVSFQSVGASVVVTETMLQGASVSRTYTVSGITQLNVNGLGGKDRIDASGLSAGVSTYFDGGDGDDTLIAGAGSSVQFGGAGNDTLIGGASNDYLFGGEGHDILAGLAGDDYLFGQNGIDFMIGGDGADQLDGGDGNDLLLAGLSSYADLDTGVNFDALAAISAEWRSSRTLAEKVANLLGLGSGGANGSWTLWDGVTEFFDDDADVLTGGAGTDWFQYSPSGELYNGTRIPVDVLVDPTASEPRIVIKQKPPGW